MAFSDQNSPLHPRIDEIWKSLDSENVPVSTSTPSSVRRKSRKSWFEATPQGKNFEIAIEKKQKPRPTGRRKSEVEDEVLLLTHFTKPPKIGFNKMKPGNVKTRTLIIKNPHDYDQQVQVEKFPFKKNFSTETCEFTVEANETFPMIITWSPEDEGNFREMILFLIDGVYRLQAFVFGTVEAPPQKRKPRKGLLGTKVKKPFSVLHTPSLANIAKSYSPKKGQKKSIEKSEKGSDIENQAPVQKAQSSNVTTCKGTVQSSNVTTCKGKERRRSHRRSQTYNKIPTMSPITPNIDSARKSVKEENLIKNDEKKMNGVTDLSQLSPVKATSCLDLQSNKPDVGPTLKEVDIPQQTPNIVRPPIQDDDIPQQTPSIYVKNLCAHKTPEDKLVQEAQVKNFVSPNSFLNDSLCSQLVKDTSFTDIRPVAKPLFSSTVLPTPERLVMQKEEKNFLSPESFLKDLNDTKENLEKSARLLEVRNCEDVPSPESVLNDSIPHDIMVKQLATVKTSLFESKIVKTSTPSPCPPKINGRAGRNKVKDQASGRQGVKSSTQIQVRRETFNRGDTVKDFCIAPISASPRRETFVKSTAMTAHFDVPPIVPSPRRETYLIPKTTKNDKSDITDRRKSLLRSPSSAFRVVSKSAEERKNIQKNKRLDFGDADSKSTSELGTETKDWSEFTEVESLTSINRVTATKDVSEFTETETFTGSIDSATVTKSKSKSESTLVENNSVGKCLFSPGELDVKVMEKDLTNSFGSPQNIPDSPSKCEFTRRATLTVMKERPSDALLHATQKRVSACLFDSGLSEEKLKSSPYRSPRKFANCSMITEECEATSKEMKQNSTHQQESNLNDQVQNCSSSSVKVGSFPSTPVDLPNSPNPDLSRRSTHVVDNPKVLNLSTGQRKRLFPPLQDNMDGSATEIRSRQGEIQDSKEENTGNTVEFMVNSENNTTVEVSAKDSLKEGEVKGHNKTGEVQGHIEDTLNKGQGIDALGFTTNVAFVVESNSETNESNVNKKETPLSNINKGVSTNISKKETPPTGKTKENSSSGNKGETTSGGSRRVAPCIPNKRSQSENRITDSKRFRSADGTANSGASTTRAPVTRTRQRHPTVTVTKPGTDGSQGKSKPSVRGLAQSKLILMKKSKTVLPKHPMPFAAKNMYYDERWMEKQERGFVHWLNFVLTPAEDYLNSSTKTKVDAGALSIDSGSKNIKLAPTKEVLSFREYAVVRRLNQLRRSACKLYQSESVVRVIQKLEAEIESRRLVIRKDKKVHADLGLKQNILDMLLSYNPLWLRIGLEVVYGELIPIQKNNDVIGLSRFIVTRLLGNPDIAQEYAHPSVPHLYRDGYADAVARHMLKKFLLLVYFLDFAKSQRLIHHNPCLFCKDSEFKTTKAILIEFSRNYLSGEGDITRHLAYFGYVVSHSQTAMDEYDFAVSNLATDLRDGVRLVRVLEVLSNKFVLMKKLRAPAISRLQKIHNAEVVFKQLSLQGITLDNGLKVTPKDVVEGHREKTLKLLWALILQYQVNVLLNTEQLKEEIKILQDSLRVRNQLAQLHRFEQGLQNKKRESAGLDLHTQNEKLALLLKWCRVVCAFYDIKIENFTVSFGDGRALCYLVHHYHPGLVPQKSIHDQTMATYYAEMEQKGQGDLDNSFGNPFSPAVVSVTEDPKLYEELLANEKENFKLLYEKVSELGGIPLMLRSVDMSNTIPDEKVVVTYIAYLCARLLDICHESRAARVIQLAWRKYHLRKSQKEFEIKQKAAITIQRWVRKYLAKIHKKRQNSAALKIQSFWRGYRARKLAQQIRFQQENALKMKAAIVIMRYLKTQILRQRFLQQRKAAVCIQAFVRGHLQRYKLRKQRQAVTTIQRFYRATISMRRARNDFSLMKQSVVKIQSVIRDWLCRKWQMKTRAATVIQAFWKMHRCRRRYRSLRSAAVFLQKYTRMQRCSKKYAELRRATISIQKIYRARIIGRIERKKYLRCKSSAIVIQKSWRLYCARRDTLRDRAATVIQSVYRGSVVRRNYGKMRKAVVTLQTAFRSWKDRKLFLKKMSAIFRLQQKFRAHLQMKAAKTEYLKMRNSAILIQSAWRMYRCKTEFDDCRQAAILIQASYRGYVQRKNFKQLCDACFIIQKHFRALLAGKEARQQFLVMRKSAVKIQAWYRGSNVRQEVKKSHNAAVVIQSWYKRYKERQRFVKMRWAVLIVQRRFRAIIEGRKVQKEYLVMKGAALTIQAYARGHQIREMIRKLNKAAVIIQSEVRRFMLRKTFLQHKIAAIKIQKKFRSTLEAKKVRKQYLIQKGAAITVQSAFRGRQVRKEIKKSNMAATIIQTVYKCYKTRQGHLKKKYSAIVLQRRFRAKIERNKKRKDFLITKGAAITIQAYFRGHKVRQEIKHSHNAAVRIQSFYRGYRQRQNYQSIKNSSIIIQRRFRLKVVGQIARKAYLIKKGAAITIQAYFRGHKVRQEIKHSHTAAVKIQSIYRGYRQRQTYQNVRNSAVVIQRHFRSKAMGQSARKAYLIKKGAAVTIQAYFRGHKVRQAVRHSHNAAVRIQSIYRGYRQRQSYQSIKNSAVVIQRHFRSKVMGQSARKAYLIKKGAAITIQAYFRGHKVRQEIKHSHNAAVRIQSIYRGYRQRQDYQSVRNSAVVIQRYFRSKVMGQSARKAYLIKKGAAITIQAYFRGHKVRQEIKHSHNAAVRIQSIYRGYRQRQNYQSVRNSAVVIQRYFRSKVMGQSARKAYLIKKGAAMTIQALYRGCVVRKQLKKSHNSAVKIQNSFRGYLIRRDYLKKKMATTLIQKGFRAYKEGKQARRGYLIKKGAAITIQAALRGHLCRRRIKTLHRAALTIQTAYRGHRSKQVYIKQKTSTIAIQRWFRNLLLGRKVRRSYLCQQSSAITIQAAFRTYKCRKDYREMLSSVVKVQSLVRGYIQRRYFMSLRNAAISCQRRFRASQLRNHVWREFMVKKGAVITIQAWCRGSLVRKNVKQQNQSAVVIQSWFRKCRQVRNFESMKCAAKSIQSWYRRCRRARMIRDQYVTTRNNVITIQKYFRGFMARKNHKENVQCVVRLQACVRRTVIQKEYRNLRQSTIILQRRYRALLKMRECRRDYQSKVKAIIKLQSVFRGFITRKAYKSKFEVIKRLQARIRCRQQRKQFIVTKSAAVAIQRHYRAFIEGKKHRSRYLSIRKSTLCLQSAVRGWLARKFCDRFRACIMIQKTFRMYRARKLYQCTRNAVISLQAAARGLLARQKYRLYTESLKCLQRNIRSHLFIHRLKKAVKQRHESATKIQAMFRGYLARKYVQRTKAAIKIQSHVKMFIARKNYLDVCNRIVALQSYVRVYLAQRKLTELRRKHSAAICIQQNYRAFRRRQLIEAEKEKRAAYLERFSQNAFINLAAVRIQRCYRNYRMLILAKQRLHSVVIIQRWMRSKLCRLHYLKFQSSLRVFQQAARWYLHRRHVAATTIQTAYRKWLVKQEDKRRIKAATVLQAVWRGRKVRKTCKNKKIEVVRKSLQEANRSATEEKKLGNRTNSALDYLLKYKQLSHILEALIHLDVATRLSPTCCERMVEVNAVHVIYTLIRSCNRSQPHMELIKYSVNVLLNLAKYDKTVSAVYNVEESVETLIELMQIYREKGVIFANTCMLLGIMGIDKSRREEIQGNSKLMEKLKSIHLLTVRKNRINEKRYIQHARQVAAKSFNSTLPIHTPHKKHHKIRPDWVLRKDKLQEFDDPLQAINFVMETLHISPK